MASIALPASVENVDESAWDVEEMRRRKEEQEAEAEESDEDPLVGGGRYGWVWICVDRGSERPWRWWGEDRLP